MIALLVSLLFAQKGFALEGNFMSTAQKSPADWSLADSKIISTETARVILGRAKELAATSKSWSNTYDWLAIAVGTGLRVSEVAHIEKSDVLPNRLMVTRRKKRHLHPAPIDVIPEVHEIIKRRADAVLVDKKVWKADQERLEEERGLLLKASQNWDDIADNL